MYRDLSVVTVQTPHLSCPDTLPFLNQGGGWGVGTRAELHCCAVRGPTRHTWHNNNNNVHQEMDDSRCRAGPTQPHGDHGRYCKVRYGSAVESRCGAPRKLFLGEKIEMVL